MLTGNLINDGLAARGESLCGLLGNVLIRSHDSIFVLGISRRFLFIEPVLNHQKGAKLLNLVPGAGLEPARTLPGPRDFKSHPTLAQQHQPKPKIRFFRGLGAGVCPCLSVPLDGLGTATGTVQAQRRAATMACPATP